jgi:ABC-type dipeptide/oligopeptide/nickel transport system permease component
MLGFVARRLLAAAPTLLAVLTLVFLIVRVIPGDPALVILGDQATPEAAAALRARLGLDRPILTQYATFVLSALTGDFGRSMVTGRPILEEVTAVLPHTLDLTGASLVIGVIVGIPAGIAAALHRNRFVDGILIGNSVLTEIVFNRPGLGKIIVGALNQRDYTMLQGLMVIYCFLIVVVNLVTDLLYGVLDPRVKA